MSNHSPEFRYEYNRLDLWLIGVFITVVMIFFAFRWFLKTHSAMSILFSCYFLMFLVIQLYSRFSRKFPYLEIYSNTITWGETGGAKGIVYFSRIFEIVTDYGGEDNNMLIIEHSGSKHIIPDVCFFDESKKLKQILSQKAAEFGFRIIESSKRVKMVGPLN